MTIIDSEIQEIQKNCENVVPGSKIITCSASLIRVDIKQNEFQRQLTVCLRYPKGYPQEPILIEIKSRCLSEKFVNGLANLAETKAKEFIGKTQAIFVLKFLEQYLKDNPLCVAYDEIVELKKVLGKHANEQLKLKQKSSTVQLTAKGGNYFFKVHAEIPEEYPQKCVILKNQASNLPAVLLRYLNGQSREIARQCVEPPARLSKHKNASAFQITPSLCKSLKFCIDATKDFFEEQCAVCENRALPENPENAALEDTNDMLVERVFCGHLFHQGCLKYFLSQPPFAKDGKVCPAKKRHARPDTRDYMGTVAMSSITTVSGDGRKSPQKKTSNNISTETCGIRISHDKWVVSPAVAEVRWAQKQAREREIQEVIDFMQ